jgi:CHAT domain-containing protein
MKKRTLLKILTEFTFYNYLVLMIIKWWTPETTNPFVNIFDYSKGMIHQAVFGIKFFSANVLIVFILLIVHNSSKFILKNKEIKIFRRTIIYCLTSSTLFALAIIPSIFMPVSTNPNSPTVFTIFGYLFNHFFQWAIGIFQSILGEGTIANVLSLPMSSVIIFTIPLILSWCMTGIFWILFIHAQTNEFKIKRKLGSILFVLLKISKALSVIVCGCIAIICCQFLLSFSIQLIALLWLSPSIFQKYSLSLPQILLGLIYLLVVHWMFLNVLMIFLLPSLTGTVIVASSLFSKINSSKFIHTYFWKIYFPFAKILQSKLIPLTIFNFYPAYSHYIILNSLISFQENSLFIIKEFEITESVVEFIMLFVMDSQRKQKFLGSRRNLLPKKIKILRLAARQMILMGNIRQAEKLYEKLLEIIEYSSTISYDESLFKEDFNVAFNIAFKELFDFYAQLNQKEKASLLCSMINDNLEKGSLSLVNGLFIHMEYNFYFENSNNTIDLSHCSSYISLDSLRYLLISLIKYSQNSWDINKPQDLNKFLIRSYIDDSELFEYIFDKEKKEIVDDLLNKIKNFFLVQERIFILAQNRSEEHTISIEEVKIATSEKLNLNFLGIDFSFDNPLAKQNYALISLIVVENQTEYSLEIIQYLTEQTILNNRSYDLPLLNCCQGKLFVDREEVDIGLSFLRDGINLFEGIRNTVSSDWLGLGFGERYLKFYDWGIEAAIQVGDIHQAFNYSEHSKARAMLDLMCQRTSSFGSGELRDRLVEIQNLDFSISLIESSIYTAPASTSRLPKTLQAILKSRFDLKKNISRKNLHNKKELVVDKIKDLDPVISSLIIFKPLSWSKNSVSDEGIYSELWTNYSISNNEAIVSYHGICSDRTIGRQWGGIVCFTLFTQDNKLQLEHCIIEDRSVVSKVQKECRDITKELYLQSFQSSRNLMSVAENLIQPMLLNLPVKVQKLIILGNDEFQFMPWSTMYIGEDEDTMESRWLVDDFSIRVTPSLSLLYLLKQREDLRDCHIPSHFSIAGVSRYTEAQHFLYWSGFEADSIAQLYDVEPIKNEAIDDYFIDDFSKATIIHFSGHADYKVDKSLNALDRAYLCLYNRNLSAADILDGALQSSTAKAMILSACLTGRGDLTGAGSEILGLERAFFYAGVSGLVTSLWPVDDVPTSLLMTRFHSIWKQHNNSLDYLSSSLAEAQIWLKKATWQELKNEVENFDSVLEECIEIYSTLIRDELSKSNKVNVSPLTEALQSYIKMKEYDNRKIPFQHPCFWAAFQVKGVG